MRACLLLCLAVLASSAACGSARAVPMRGVLVYAKGAGLDGQPTANEQVWRARLDGTHARTLAHGDDPAVSPDGRWVAFGRGAQMLVMPTAGGSARTVYTVRGEGVSSAPPPLAGGARWAADSRRFAFGGNQGLAVVDVRTWRVMTIAAAEYAQSFDFSPDSKRIVYDVDGNLYVISADGGKPMQLTDDHKSSGPVWGKPGIAFVRFTHGADGDIWLSDGHPGHARQLTHTGTGFWPAAFSADGTKLLGFDPPLHNGRLWAVDVPTGKARPITRWIGDLTPQGLSGDGKTVLAHVGCGGNPGSIGYVETIPFSGGKPHVIVRGTCGASWTSR